MEVLVPVQQVRQQQVRQQQVREPVLVRVLVRLRALEQL